MYTNIFLNSLLGFIQNVVLLRGVYESPPQKASVILVYGYQVLMYQKKKNRLKDLQKTGTKRQSFYKQ